uniref:Uncharacterized protein n=1 Tax=Opuntia streptacantha TaxID=393608 RepID=A0A7C8Z8C7_OPUST
MISFRVFAMSPILVGIHPPNSLFAITKTETGELPILAGIPNRNRLLFKNNASNGLSKTAGGMGPSNSLNRISKYFKAGKCNKTGGNFPANRLLLKSNSYNNFIDPKLFGTVPQNRLELI